MSPEKLGAAVAKWLACWLCNPRIAGLILRSSSLSDETINEPSCDKTNKMICAPREVSDQSLRCPHKENLGP